MVFNDEQLKIINQIDGPVIVVACPGSGKTTTVLERTNNIIKSGIDPNKILVVTFTKNAADEMKTRFEERYDAKGTVFCTIHSLCFGILRKYEGLDAQNILKEWEQYKYFKEYFKNVVDQSDMDSLCERIISEISYVTNAKLSSLEYKSACKTKEGDLDFHRCYQDYQNFKKQIGKIDFDDMLVKSNIILHSDAEELNYWQDSFPYICIDEFQDTNIIQSEIFYLLAEKYNNLCVVGDDDQSIYGFRSADSSIMLNFEKSFPNAKRFTLSTNYRSCKNIVEEAGNLISHNNVRFDKEFKAYNDKNGIIVKKKMEDIDERGTEYIVDQIRKWKKDGVPYEEMSILFRINKIAVPLISALLDEDIPFKTKEAIPDIHKEFFFWDLKHYYALAEGKGTMNDLLSILNHPTRFLKKTDFEKVDKPNRFKMLAVCEKYRGQGQRYYTMKARINDLFDTLELLKGKTPVQYVKIIYTYEYKKWMEDFIEFIHRDERNVMTSFEQVQNEAINFETMEDWFKYADEYGKILQEKRNAKEGVTLATFHGAKGLEWEKVIVYRTDKDMTPYKLAVTDAEIEEERRMFYVAITRAKNELQLLYKSPSEFLEELKHKKENLSKAV